MTEMHWDWHEKQPYTLMEYRTIIRTSTGATPYSLMYRMEAVVSAKVGIPSLCILMEAQLKEDEWMVCVYNKKVKPHPFEIGDKVLKRILPVSDKAKGKFAPNWQRPFIVKKVLSG
ncbi:uncharacterized protein [Coffea arabica]|uniref:RNA-directed DNA polymerase homolog n=1 Tax=Coffea arabica TaxID=13443 RepID=A0ABM4UYB7_COFAR